MGIQLPDSAVPKGTAMNDTRILIDWKALKALGWPYSRQHTYRLVRDGKFPRPLKFGNYRRARIAWRYEEIQAYLDGLPRG